MILIMTFSIIKIQIYSHTNFLGPQSGTTIVSQACEHSVKHNQSNLLRLNLLFSQFSEITCP